MEGMKYVGGPLLNPCSDCGKTNVVRFVGYFEGNDLQSNSDCPKCKRSYDIHKLLVTNKVCLGF